MGGEITLFSRPLTLSDISLFVQLIAFLILGYALAKKKKNIRLHGKVASFAFIVTLPPVLYMLYFTSLGLALPAYGWLLTLHKLLGFLTLILGIIFVTNQWKWKVKKYMDLCILCWTGAFLLGIAVYLILFGFISPS